MTGDLLKRFIGDVLFEENGPPAIRLQAIQELITQYTNLAMSTASDEFELDISTRAERMHEFHKQLARRVSEEIPIRLYQKTCSFRVCRITGALAR